MCSCLVKLRQADLQVEEGTRQKESRPAHPEQPDRRRRGAPTRGNEARHGGTLVATATAHEQVPNNNARRVPQTREARTTRSPTAQLKMPSKTKQSPAPKAPGQQAHPGDPADERRVVGKCLTTSTPRGGTNRQVDSHGQQSARQKGRDGPRSNEGGTEQGTWGGNKKGHEPHGTGQAARCKGPCDVRARQNRGGGRRGQRVNESSQAHNVHAAQTRRVR